MPSIRTSDTDLPSIQVLGFPFFSGTKSELLQKIAERLQAPSVTKQGGASEVLSIFTPNPEQVMQAEQTPHFRKVLLKAQVLLADGAGIVGAARILLFFGRATGVPHKIGGRELVEACLRQFPQASVLVIGGVGYEQYAPARPVSELGAQAVELSWQGKSFIWTPGYHSVAHPTAEEEHAVGQLIAKLQPEIVCVAFGAPYQEEWIVTHTAFLHQHHVKICMAVGGSFDVLLGKLKRPPALISNLGLEWAFRLLQEPWRWRRQLRLLQFFFLTWREVLKPRYTA